MADKSIFSNLIQVGVVVKDMDKAIERLTSLGIGPFQPKILPSGTQEWFRGKPFTGKASIKAAMMGDVELELVQPVAGESPQSEFMASKGEGFQHIAFAVEDLDQAVTQLTKQGIEVLLRAKMPGGGGVVYLDLGAGGIIVELIQRKSRA
jgi:catechol 2,3-dioxygenase-like lactoylglutathione lyase family enzyme